MGGDSQGRRRPRFDRDRLVIAMSLVGADHQPGQKAERPPEVRVARRGIVDDPDLEAVDASGSWSASARGATHRRLGVHQSRAGGCGRGRASPQLPRCDRSASSSRTRQGRGLAALAFERRLIRVGVPVGRDGVCVLVPQHVRREGVQLDLDELAMLGDELGGP